MGSLRLLSQIGVILFMFIVGIDLDAAHLRRTAHAAVLVSHAEHHRAVPARQRAVAGALPLAGAAGDAVSAFALFMGIAMSITAFPVLARILEERGSTRTPLGATAIACAAVDDVTAWCLLALVVAIVKATALAGALITVRCSLPPSSLRHAARRPAARRRG